MTNQPTPPAVHPLARVALETTLLLHGVPRDEARPLALRLATIVRNQGAVPLLAGVVRGRPAVGLNDHQLDELLAAPSVRKLNTANLGVALARGEHGATTVSTTMELAAGAGVGVFATGGIGGAHVAPPGAPALDVSADLHAFTRFPVAVIASGVKSILDVAGTREMLETLGVPVIGYRTDDFPAFYLRRADADVAPVDARFDDIPSLAAYVRRELARSRRGIVICNPIPAEHELALDDWRRWLADARAATSDVSGRDVTPRLLAELHRVSSGATLRANIALVESNAQLAGQLAHAMVQR